MVRILNLLHLRGDDHGVCGGQLTSSLCTEIVTAVMLFWQAMRPTMTTLTLSAFEIGECELLGAAGAALLSGCSDWRTQGHCRGLDQRLDALGLGRAEYVGHRCLI